MPLDLNTIWFLLLGILLTGYAILDGFDLGVGMLHLFSREDKDRRIILNSIGPVWDGNEVWLVTAGGALFAAFPDVYATVFSGFYTAFMLLLFALIFRAAAIEFRSKQKAGAWKNAWDISFSVSSLLASFLIGVAFGNIAYGVPIGPDREFAGTFLSILHPYSIMIGILTVALFLMHGSIYLVMKTEGDLHERIRGWVKNCMIFFILSFVIITAATLLYVPHLADSMRHKPFLFLLPVLGVLAIANIPREITRGRDFNAFLSSCFTIIILMAIFGTEMYPHLVFSQPHPENSLTIYNAVSSPLTLKVMLIIAILGVPLVLSYTIIIYWIFRGKVKLDSHSY